MLVPISRAFHQGGPVILNQLDSKTLVTASLSLYHALLDTVGITVANRPHGRLGEPVEVGNERAAFPWLDDLHGKCHVVRDTIPAEDGSEATNRNGDDCRNRSLTALCRRYLVDRHQGLLGI
ncbi:hypothetical protein D3C80_1542370 [compost metagenome]